MIYTFQCKECGSKFEAEQSARDHELHKDPNCPKCGNNNHEHLISRFFAITAKKS